MQAAGDSDRIRVLLADDHRLFGQALEALLNGDERFEVIGYAENGREAVELATKLRPDVTLMDISMPVLDGVEATRGLREAIPDARVLMLTGSTSDADIDRARRAGAAAYLTKDKIASELIKAMLEILDR